MRQAGVSVKDSIRVSRSKGYDKYELPIAPYVKGAETAHEQQKAMVQYNPPGASRWAHSTCHNQVCCSFCGAEVAGGAGVCGRRSLRVCARVMASLRLWASSFR